MGFLSCPGPWCRTRTKLLIGKDGIDIGRTQKHLQGEGEACRQPVKTRFYFLCLHVTIASYYLLTYFITNSRNCDSRDLTFSKRKKVNETSLVVFEMPFTRCLSVYKEPFITTPGTNDRRVWKIGILKN